MPQTRGKQKRLLWVLMYHQSNLPSNRTSPIHSHVVFPKDIDLCMQPLSTFLTFLLALLNEGKWYLYS